MREIIAKAGQEICIGKRGENNAVCVVFDVSDWRAVYGAGNVQLIHQRNGDKTPYPCPVEVSGGAALWTITKTDVGNPGIGRAELQYWVGDAIVKSEIFSTKTARSMGDAGEVPPAPATTWLEQMQQLGIETEENAEAAEASAKAAAASAASVKTSEESAAASARSAAASEASVAANAQSAKTSAESAAVSAATAEAANSEIAASKAVAESAARSASDSASAAAQSAAEVKTSENNAAASANAAAVGAQSASAAQQAAASAASAASASASTAAQSATKAATSEKNTADSEAAAKAAQKAAEDARDAASEIVGGDFASKTEAQGYANTAESNANSYTDRKVAAIPAPDVSGEIDKHNADNSAHGDIRTSIYNHVANNGNPHGTTAAHVGAVAKSGDTMTGDLTAPNINSVIYTQDYATARVPASNAIAASPFARFLWHNKLAFFSQNHGTYKGESIIDNQVSTDGETWESSDTNLKQLFSGLESNSVTLMNASQLARRFTLSFGSVAYSGIEWIEIATNHDCNSSFSLKIETSSDNATWQTVNEVTVSGAERAFYIFTDKAKWNRNAANAAQIQYVRFTFTKLTNLTSGIVTLICLKGLTQRKGAQGEGIEKEYPYSWDADRNMIAKGTFTAKADPTTDMGVATKRYVDNAGSAHNTSTSAHSDIRAAAATAQATANSKASTATYTVPVDTSWSENSAGGYYKTVTVSGILASDNPIADVVLGSDVDANEAYRGAWGVVTRIVTADGSITLYATDVPETAFTIQLKVVR